MLKIKRDFYESSCGGVVYQWSTEINGEVLTYRAEQSYWQAQQTPIPVLERQARRAFEQKLFEGAFRE